MTQKVRDPAGRELSVESVGDPEGKPVFLLHGTPGGRGGPRPRHIVLYRLGVRLISFDRPGYPGSTRHQERTVAAAAENVQAIADYFGIERFSVVGRSGGAPHALACAALLPDRVVSAAALVSLAPPNVEGLDWTAGMTKFNVEAYRLAVEDPVALRALLKEQAENINKDSEGLLRALWPEMDDHDREVIDDVALRRIIADTHVEALSNNCVDGWVDDVIALGNDWKFDPAKIEVPVKLWAGRDDRFSPANHTFWLAQQIAGAEVDIANGKAHFGAVKILPQILTWLTKKANKERPSELAADHDSRLANSLTMAGARARPRPTVETALTP